MPDWPLTELGEALDRLKHRFQGLTRKIAAGAQSGLVADDVWQEICAKILVKAARTGLVNKGEGGLHNYVLTTMINLRNGLSRKKQVRDRHQRETAASPPEPGNTTPELANLRTVVQDLDDLSLELLWLRHCEGLTVVELGKRIGKEKTMAAKRAHEATKALFERLLGKAPHASERPSSDHPYDLSGVKAVLPMLPEALDAERKLRQCPSGSDERQP